MARRNRILFLWFAGFCCVSVAQAQDSVCKDSAQAVQTQAVDTTAISATPTEQVLDTTALASHAKKYVAAAFEEPKQTFFQGFTLGVDLFSPAQYLLTDGGGFEGALRLNLLNTYLPIVEVGYLRYDKTDENTDIRYATTAPYARIGIDVNVLNNKWQDNRLYVGARYGISKYDFDISGPSVTDPIWGGEETFSYKGISMTSQWLELVCGVEVSLWRNFHMGWSVRYKQKLASTKSRYAEPYYIPGYGTTTGAVAWGITYSLIFDLNWGKKLTPEQQAVLKARKK